MNCYQKFYTNQIHSSSLLCQLATMWKSQVLCDAIIRTGQTITKAHRVILVAACPMLQSMENASMGSHLEVRLAADIKQDSINTFLQYLYEGFMMLTEENCKDVEKIARLLQVDSVMKCCNDFYKCLSVKTGHTFCASDQYKFSSYDMLEFRHVRSSDIQKTVQERMMKRGSDFTRPTSPSSKRQRMHKPSSPSYDILGASHRADDTVSMAHSYGGPTPDPWDRVPRLGAGMRHNVSSQPGVIDIVEDSIEIIQTEHPEKDARGNLRPDSRVKQKRESIAVSSQMNSVADVQIVNVSDKSDSSSTKQSSANSSTNATAMSGTGRGSITVSPLSMFNDTSSAIPVARNSTHPPKPQSHSSPDVQEVQSVQRNNDSVVPNSLSQPVFPTSISPVSRLPPISLAKPFAAGSAQQAGDTSSGKVQRSEDSQNDQEKNTPSPALFEKEQDNSGKTDGECSRLSADKAPDISIVKIEQDDENTGGLDMYVDIPEDGMMRIRRGIDDTEHEEGSDLEHDVMREEASNEGSNVSGDQNNSWYIGQFKEAAGAYSVSNLQLPTRPSLQGNTYSQDTFINKTSLDETSGNVDVKFEQQSEISSASISPASCSDNNLFRQSRPTYTSRPVVCNPVYAKKIMVNYEGLEKIEHKPIHTEHYKQKRCVFCQYHKIKTKSGWKVLTQYRCEKCDVPLCTGERNCFINYHNVLFGTDAFCSKDPDIANMN